MSQPKKPEPKQPPAEQQPPIKEDGELDENDLAQVSGGTAGNESFVKINFTTQQKVV